MKCFRVFFGLVLLMLFLSMAGATVPPLINFQGILRNGTGNPVPDASYSVTFTIYDAVAGGNNLWTETQSVTTSNGLFAVLLGSSNPVPDTVFKSWNRWLGIAVSPDPEMPRQQLVSVGYAYRVNSVDSASGGTITGKVSIGPGHINTGADAFMAGANNRARGAYSVVGGGGGTAILGLADSNAALGDYSVIGGGFGNTAGGMAATVGGGGSNRSLALYSTVGGGTADTAGQKFATVPGGYANKASGNYSFAAGRRAKADDDGSFVWGDGTDADVASTAPNQFVVRAQNGLVLPTNATAAKPVAVGEYYRDNGLIAWGKVNGATGTLTDDYGVLGVVRTGAGSYQVSINAATAGGGASMVPVLTIIGTLHFATISVSGASLFNVSTFNLSFVLEDADFVFMVTGR